MERLTEEVIGNLKVVVGMDTTEFVGKSRSFGDQLKILKSNMSELNNTVSRLDNQSSLLSKKIENNRKQYDLYNQKIKENNQVISNSNQRMKEAHSRVSELNQKKKDGISLTEKEQKELNVLVKEMGQFTKAEQKAANQTARFQAELAKLNSEYTELMIKQKTQGDKWLSFGNSLQNVGKRLNTIGDLTARAGTAITTASAVVGAGIFGLVKVASDYESAFAGVRKTVDATEPQLQQLSAGFRSLSKELPITANEFAKIGENAGQLGIHVPNILGFSETMAKLGMATNLSSDEASTSLAKFANITQMSQNNFDKLGSSIVALGNNFATTEADIVSMAMNLAGAGHSVGLTEADILAVSTALSSVGIEAERGGSTFSKLMVNMKVASEVGYRKAEELSEMTGLSMRELELMASNDSKAFKGLADDIGMTANELEKIITANKNLRNFAEVAGMDEQSFQELFNNYPVEAISKFVDGLATANERGTTAVEILNEMGISEIRLRDTLLRMGGAQSLFNNALKVSNDAWEKNSALTKEVSERNKTTASQFEIFKNKIIDVAISGGEKLLPVLNDMMKNSDWLIDSIKGVVSGFANMDDGMKKFIIQSVLLGTALGPVLNVFGNGMKLVGTFNSVIGSGLVKFREFKNVATVTAGASDALTTATTKAGLATKAFVALSNPWVLGIALGATAIGGLVVAYNHLTKESRESAERVKRWGSDVGVELDATLLKTKKFSDEVAINMNLTEKVDASKIANGYSGMFKGLLETVDANTKEFEKMYEKLPEVAKKYAKDDYDNRVKHHEEIKSKISENEISINNILKKASDERRALRQDEKDYIAKLEDQSKQLAVSTFKKDNANRLEIMKRLSSDLNNLDENTVATRLVKLKETGKKISDEYQVQVKSLKDALNEGFLSEREYTNSVKELDEELLRSKRDFAIRYIEIAEERLKRMDERISKSSGIEKELLLQQRKQMLEEMEKTLQEYGYTWEKAVNDRKNDVENLKKESSMLANASNTMIESLSENVKKANEHWNDLITDKETGRVVSNISKVITEAIKTQDGWDLLKFDIKHADLSTNAREEIKKVLDATGKWDELTLEEKTFVTATNSGLILAKILQDKGEWDALNPEVKQMLLHTNADVEQVKYMTAFSLWKDAEFVEKWAKIDTTAPDAQQKFTELLNKWRSNDFETKKVWFESNKDAIDEQINKITNRINNVPTSRNIRFNIGVTGLHTAQQALRGLSVDTAYASGTQRHRGGLAILGDGGRREPFLTPDGLLGVSPSHDTIYDLPSGTKVWSSINKFRNSVKYDKVLKGLISRLPHFATGTTSSFLNFNTKHDFLNSGRSSVVNVNKSSDHVNNYTINISDIIVREELDIRKISDEVIRQIDRKNRTASKMRGEYYV